MEADMLRLAVEGGMGGLALFLLHRAVEKIGAMQATLEILVRLATREPEQ